MSQPQLLAVLGLMRYADRTFRETEVRLRAHRELRRGWRLPSVPDYTTWYRFRKRLDERKINPALGAAARRLGPVGRRRGRARVAVDATGLAQGAVRTFLVRRMDHPTGQPLPWRHWRPWLVTVEVARPLRLSQAARLGPGNDCANLPLWGEAASPVAPIGRVLAAAEFARERNHPYIRQPLRAPSILPAKRGKKSWRIQGVRAALRHAFPRQQYARRALVETVFSTVKRQLSARAPGRSLFTPWRPA